MYLKKSITIHIVIFIIFIIITTLSIASTAHDKPPSSDDHHYVLMGYNFQKYGTISLEDGDIADPEPTAFREPGYPVYLAICIFLNPGLRNMDLEELYSGGLRTLRLSQIPLVIITAIFVMFIIYSFTGSYLLAYIAMFLTGASEVMATISNHLLSENLAALLIVLVSLSLYKIFKTGRMAYFIMLGISMGALVLTKAIFIYLAYILIMIILILLFRKYRAVWKRFLAGIFLFLFIYFAIMGGWMFRNYKHFNEFTVTNKSGIVLYYRSVLDTMTRKEYLASFIYWLPGEGTRKTLLDRFFDEEDYSNLDRKDESGYRQGAKKVFAEMQDSYIQQGYGEQESVLLADKEMRQAALQRIIRDPLRHILATIPIAWKGTFIETGYSFMLRNPNWFILQLRSVVFLNIFLFFCFFYVIVYSIVKKKWAISLFFLTPFYLFFMHSFMTHNKARYNYPLIPLMIIAAVLLAHYFIQIYKNRDRSISN